jgi:hypothetical protein
MQKSILFSTRLERGERMKWCDIFGELKDHMRKGERPVLSSNLVLEPTEKKLNLIGGTK